MSITLDSEPRKKMIPLFILEILQKYTDPEHPITQTAILEKLIKEYKLEGIDRKCVARNLRNLQECGYELVNTGETSMTTVRDKYTKEKIRKERLTNFYLIKNFDDSELRLMADSLMFSKSIPSGQLSDLTDKIAGLSSIYFKSHIKHFQTYQSSSVTNSDLFHSIDILDEAIERGRQVKLKYCSYGADKELHPHKDEAGNDRLYTINPYQLVISNGRYYLICNFDGHDNLSNLRIDRIKDIECLNAPVREQRTLREAREGLDLSKYMREHIYMFSGESIVVNFKFEGYLLNDVIDWFGSNIYLKEEKDGRIKARVTVNAEAMEQWATQYARSVTVLKPQELVDKIKENIRQSMSNYGM